MRSIDEIQTELLNIIKDAYRQGQADKEDGYDCSDDEGFITDAKSALFSVLDPELEQITTARNEGRMWIAPCKAGDTVWRIKAAFSFCETPIPETVEAITIYSDANIVRAKSGLKFHFEAIGKTVFLTEAEARAALEADNG